MWKNGDVFSFMMDMYKLSFKEALEKLATELNINIKEYQFSNNKNKLSNKKQYHTVMKQIALYYNKNLKKHLINNNISFLESKNITFEKIEKYCLGLSNQSSDLESFFKFKIY